MLCIFLDPDTLWCILINRQDKDIQTHTHTYNTYTDTHTHTCIHTDIHTHTCIHTCVCTCTYIQMYIHTHHTHIDTHIHTDMHTYTLIHMHTYSHSTYSYIHTHTHACSYVHIYTQNIKWCHENIGIVPGPGHGGSKLKTWVWGGVGYNNKNVMVGALMLLRYVHPGFERLWWWSRIFTAKNLIN